MNAEQASKDQLAGADLAVFQGKPPSCGEVATDAPTDPAGVVASACMHRRSIATREAPTVRACDSQLESREGQARPGGVAERPVVVRTPGNSGRAKGP